MGEVIRLQRGSARCGLCAGNGRIVDPDGPPALIACPRCFGSLRMAAAPDNRHRPEPRVVPFLAWHALNAAGFLALGVGAFMLIATARFVIGS